MKSMLTTSDVAQLLGLHPNTVRRWNRRGILKSYRVGARGDRRFQREDIDGFLKSMARGTGCDIGFAEYVHRKYPKVDEDIITMIEDILEHPPKGRG